MIGWKLFNAVSTSRKLPVNGRLLLPFHDAVLVVREQHALQPLAQAVVSAHVLCAVAYARVCGIIAFCLFFGKIFNIMSALFVHQLPTLPQIIDSREGLFRCKMGLVVHADKMNIYFIKPRFAPYLGLFAAKCSAIWYKMQCILVLNAVRFGAKCDAFWCKM